MALNANLILLILEDTDQGEKLKLRRYIDEKKYYFFCKRIFDIIVSILVITTILGWLLPLIALLIKLDSRGPVFFLQKRVGRGGRSFYCIKFRTMISNAEADKKQAMENDWRITRLGKFLRKSNLDEFPQFFNVLISDMSIVGPRPHMLMDCQVFGAFVKGYKFRNLVRPGITGIAQTKGFSGPVDNYEDIFRRFQWDAFYVRTANFLLDMRIIRQTVRQQLNFILFLFHSHSSGPISRQSL